MNPIPDPFIAQLDPDELTSLRAAIRAIHRDRFLGQAPLSVEECDFLIEKIGPNVAREMLRSGGR